MARTPQDVTETELAVLQVLWERGPATIRQITALLYPHGGTSHYATVQKLLERLQAKDCVRRDRRPPVHVFAAAINRDELVGRRLQTVAAQLCGGSMTPLLTHLVRAQRLSTRERQEWIGLIEELEREKRPKERRH
jgi:BlaI family penicillinase repressor